MIYLLIVSFIWAFSFGLIKGSLTGLDPNFVSFVRILISFLIFLPFLKLKNIELKFAAKLVFIGMFQFGVMYIAYIYSFQFLQAHQVALFTIFTPLYVTLLNDILKKKFHLFFLLAALTAAVGTGIIVYENIGRGDLLAGFLLVQVSNICFAAGQVFYKRAALPTVNRRKDIKDRHIFAFLYFGALLITAFSIAISGGWNNLSLEPNQVFTLLYLGVLASGVCFFLWNYGAKKTNIGALAVLNNMKVPLAVACSMLFFNESGDVLRLLIGGGIIVAALFIKTS
ncbi:MAG: EamA family transporter [Candidatus Aminicenantes bacterium]|nr:EamA family transporter [Candidatus Aminicenantes bacterium]